MKFEEALSPSPEAEYPDSQDVNASLNQPQSSTDDTRPERFGKLYIHVKNAKDLANNGSADTTANPFVRCYLVPDVDVGGKRKTSIGTGTTQTSAWDEQYCYDKVNLDDLCTQRALEVSLWDSNRQGANNFVGALRLGPAEEKRPGGLHSSGGDASHWEDMLANTGEWVECWHDLRPSMMTPSKEQTSKLVNGSEELEKYNTSPNEEVRTKKVRAILCYVWCPHVRKCCF